MTLARAVTTKWWMMNKKHKKEKFVDDGRVIAPMNVSGMPWYDENAYKAPSEKGEEQENQFNFNELSKQEKKEYRRQTVKIIFGLLKYVIPLLMIFVIIFGLVIFLMTSIWK